jgi:adenylate cyclase
LALLLLQVIERLGYLDFVSSDNEIGLSCPWVIAEVCLGSEHLERRLRTIFAADVSGYGRLTSADEEGTHVRLKEHLRVLVDPKISEHRGRIVKNTGDGMMAEFGSAVDAVRCAVDIQRGMAERNADVPQDRRIEFRIGINVGDIIIDSGDIFGDDVNVAVRLEGLADPGGICVSARVHEHVKDQTDICFEDAGERQLKNVSKLVRVYQVLLDWPSGAALPPRQRRPGLTATVKPSIAVLPLTNMTGNAEMESFCDSFSDDVIANLSRFRELAVIARAWGGGDWGEVRHQIPARRQLNPE